MCKQFIKNVLNICETQINNLLKICKTKLNNLLNMCRMYIKSTILHKYNIILIRFTKIKKLINGKFNFDESVFKFRKIYQIIN